MSRQIVIHVHKTKDAVEEKDPKLVAAKKEAMNAIEAANRKCAALRGMLKDRDDASQVRSAESFLRDALGKLDNEVLSA